MFGFPKVLVFSTLLISAFASPRYTHHEDSLVDWERLSNLLDTIDTGVLHQVLHSLSPKYQDGVFSKDRSAIEVVHSENPVVASKLVYIAKRQSNSTITSSAAPETSTTPAQSSAAESVSSQLASQITASQLPSPTTILVAPSTPAGLTPVSTISNGVVYKTVGGGYVTVTSQQIGVSFTRSTSTRLFYTTLPNGDVQTSTSLIVVNAPVTAVATGAAGSEQTSSAGLQNGAAKATGAAIVGFFAGAAGLLAAAV